MTTPNEEKKYVITAKQLDTIAHDARAYTVISAIKSVESTPYIEPCRECDFDNNGRNNVVRQNALDDFLERYKDINESGECVYAGNEPEQCDAEYCGVCVALFVRDLMRGE